MSSPASDASVRCFAYAGRSVHRPHGRGVRTHWSGRKGGRTSVSAENIVGLIVAVCLVIYLVACLIFPEKF
ncbi:MULTISPECIES: K(+)-transporting ATPase subunit F [unclassified Streptomyces]|uniref:K(+)-transporting ATPase subunit F n=1 Tax=unclassified Streptomyces TaxID=2593676 RepID=UPI002B1D7D20|nr:MULTISPECIES: K(+)-transporting ATPase subunit F [unclassified Streptomyces]